MTNYIPFLKTKQNEFACLKALSPEIAENIIPFFDIHRKIEMYTEDEYKRIIDFVYKKIINNLKNFNVFYLDDFSIDDDLIVDRKQSYNYVIEKFQDFNFIPVIGIDRKPERNEAVFNNNSIIKNNTIAIRVSFEDIQTGVTDIKDLILEAKQYFDKIELIIDLQFISQDEDINQLFSKIDIFLKRNIYNFSKIIITGSSIPEVISKIISTDSTKDIPRKELELYSLIDDAHKNLFYGDYAFISPLYAEFEVDPTMFLNITAAKIFYPYEKRFYIIRGSSIKSKGYNQYKTLCSLISSKPFFRGGSYSPGDNFIENAQTYPKNITQGSILAPTLNAHITYMYKDFLL